MMLTVCSATAAELEGFYASIRGSVDQGNTTYQSISDCLNGWAAEGSLGWRFPAILKLGLVGLYENLTLQGTTGSIGPTVLYGGGLQARFFFVSTVFLEGEGGIIQAKMTTSSTGNDLVAAGTFYVIGPGAEFKLSENLSFELSLRVRNALFPQNEFIDTRAIYYSTGLTLYFR